MFRFEIRGCHDSALVRPRSAGQKNIFGELTSFDVISKCRQTCELIAKSRVPTFVLGEFHGNCSECSFDQFRNASPICFRLFTQEIRGPCRGLDLVRVSKKHTAINAMTAIKISTSIRVSARQLFLGSNNFIPWLWLYPASTIPVWRRAQWFYQILFLHSLTCEKAQRHRFYTRPNGEKVNRAVPTSARPFFLATPTLRDQQPGTCPF